MASIQVLTRKTGKSYRVQFMRNGNRVSKVFTRKKDAEQFLAQITVSDELADALTNVTLTSTTIQQAIHEYLEQHKGRDKSVPQRLGWWVEHLGDKTLNKVNRQRIKNAISILEAEGKAPATLNRYKAALSAVFAYMCDRYDLKVNPCLEVKQKREDNARTRFLSADELARLMKATKLSKWERLHMLVHMALTTGARRGELIGLKWSDINFNTRTAHLAVTKNGSQRVLSLTADLLTELSQFREIGASFVFPHPSGLNRPFTEFDYHWQAAKKAALLSDFHFHDLRHSCASLLAMNGASILEIAEVLGKVSSGLLPTGTLLMSSRAPIGYLAITQMPVAVNQGYIAMPLGGQLPPLYMLFWCRLNMEMIKSHANGSTFMEISKKAFRPLPALVPSTEVIVEFMRIAEPLFARLVENQKQAQTLATLRDTLLPRLISGQLRLPDAEQQLKDLAV